VDSDVLIDERDSLRRECRSLRGENDALKKDPDRVREMLLSLDEGLEACVADAIFAAHRTEAQQEVLRAIRRRAAALALHCMSIMERCSCAVQQSALLRVHVGALRPREAGGRDSAVDAVVPSISRVYKSLSLQISCAVLWVLGTLIGLFLVLFDSFEPASAQEWVACGSIALTLPAIVGISGMLNTKTARSLLKNFETLYVLAYVLGVTILLLFLFREHPAKMVSQAIGIPSMLLAGLLDAYPEGGRLLNSRVFFALNVAGLLALLALVSLRLGTFADYTFEVGTFSFLASSMVCNAIATLLVFGVKNIALSFYEPGSLVVYKSAVCCVHTDEDALAVLKGSYSLLGQSFGKYKPNETVDKHLKRQRKSITEFRQAASDQLLATAVMRAPRTSAVATSCSATKRPETETRAFDESRQLRESVSLLVEEDGVDVGRERIHAGVTASAVPDGPDAVGLGNGCPPLDFHP
jgi:hypothetical protein